VGGLNPEWLGVYTSWDVGTGWIVIPMTNKNEVENLSWHCSFNCSKRTTGCFQFVVISSNCKWCSSINKEKIAVFCIECSLLLNIAFNYPILTINCTNVPVSCYLSLRQNSKCLIFQFLSKYETNLCTLWENISFYL
jgi:hypothetical protein